MAVRYESDLLGSVPVPADALYGVRTQRALNSFPLAQQRPLGSFPTLVEAMLQIKQAAAEVNGRLGVLPPEKAQALAEAAAELAAKPRPELFPVHALHGGGGVAANMNVNEVLANLAEEKLGGRRGEYRLFHPNDHVNANQSTNDVYPTAGHMAIIQQWARLEPALLELAEAFGLQAIGWQDARRIARTCLQDAVEVTFYDFFHGYVGGLMRSRDRIATAVDKLYAVTLGGTIVGRPADVPAAYFDGILPALRQVTGDRRYERAANLVDAFQNPDDLAAVSGALELLARTLIKQAQDLRLLSSGPEAGFGELTLPAIQPGSSIMPGKVNPSIPEFVIQLGFKVMGLHRMCAAGVDHGELDLNIWESSMICAVLEAMELLETAVTVFTAQCVRGLSVNRERSAQHADTLIPLLTRLSLKHGYSTVTAIYKEAQGDSEHLRELLTARLGE